MEHTLDYLQADILLGRASVRGWKGFTANGEPFPYSGENRDFLMRKSVEFARFVNSACMDMQRLAGQERAQKRKNS